MAPLSPSSCWTPPEATRKVEACLGRRTAHAPGPGQARPVGSPTSHAFRGRFCVLSVARRAQEPGHSAWCVALLIQGTLRNKDGGQTGAERRQLKGLKECNKPCTYARCCSVRKRLTSYGGHHHSSETGNRIRVLGLRAQVMQVQNCAAKPQQVLPRSNFRSLSPGLLLSRC